MLFIIHGISCDDNLFHLSYDIFRREVFIVKLGMIQKSKKSIRKPLVPDEAAEIVRLIGRYPTIIGISMVISIFVSLYLEQNWSEYYFFLKGVNIGSVIWIMTALISIVFGISIIANYGTKEKVIKIKGLKIRNAFLVQFIWQLPYAIIIGSILGYLFSILDGETLTG